MTDKQKIEKLFSLYKKHNEKINLISRRYQIKMSLILTIQTILRTLNHLTTLMASQQDIIMFLFQVI